MPSSTVLKLADPHEYQRSARATDLQCLVATRGTFEATLTRIDLHRLGMQRAHVSPPGITDAHIARWAEVLPSEIICYSPRSEHCYRTSTSCRCDGCRFPGISRCIWETLFGHELAVPMNACGARITHFGFAVTERAQRAW
jgi:hypothetical protein